MSLQDQKLGNEEVELNEEDLNVIAGGSNKAQELEQDDTNIGNCHGC